MCFCDWPHLTSLHLLPFLWVVTLSLLTVVSSDPVRTIPTAPDCSFLSDDVAPIRSRSCLVTYGTGSCIPLPQHVDSYWCPDRNGGCHGPKRDQVGHKPSCRRSAKWWPHWFYGWNVGQGRRGFWASALTRGKRFPCMLECRPRLFSLILLMVIMTFVPTGKMPHGGYVGCMDPRDPPGNRCWHLLTMY